MSDANDRTKPSDATTDVDREDAAAEHDADRPPTEEEAEAAPTTVSDSVKEHHEEANERGARVRGEGAIGGSPAP